MSTDVEISHQPAGGGQGDPPAGRPVDPTLRQRWRRWRFPIGIVGVLVLVAIVVTILQDQGGRGYLDPEGVNISGARALVRTLEGQGVEVSLVRSNDDAVAVAEPGGTILVTEPDRLVPEQFDLLAETGADIVFVAPAQIDRLAPQLRVAGQRSEEVLDAGCDLPVAQRAGAARLGGRQYSSAGEATTCYHATLVASTTATDGRLTVIGTAAPLTNRHLDENGNAALAMGLLGASEHLVWYRPSQQPPPGAARGILDLLPGWVVPVLAQLVVATAVAAWWRARRLGAVVTEPLPVAVRAAETTEGRARLYRRGRSRGHAAAILRNAALRRLRRRLGLAVNVPANAVVDTLSTRTSQSPDSTAAVLSGPEPADDAELVHLAHSLDALEQEVRRS